MSQVTVNRIDWRLTDPILKALGAELRKEAMRDAISKADDYASVVGREVTVVQITDQSIWPRGIGIQSVNYPSRMQSRNVHPTTFAPDGISFTPEKVVLRE